MEDSVLVFVGDWDIDDHCHWGFSVGKDFMARCIKLTSEMEFHQFMAEIKQAFGKDLAHSSFKLSFWAPQEFAVFTQGKTPPVSVQSDTDLQLFKKKRVLSPGLHMYLSITGTLSPVASNPCIHGDKSNPSADEDCVDEESSVDDELLIAFADKVEAESASKLLKPVVTKPGFSVCADAKTKRVHRCSQTQELARGPQSQMPICSSPIKRPSWQSNQSPLQSTSNLPSYDHIDIATSDLLCPTGRIPGSVSGDLIRKNSRRCSTQSPFQTVSRIPVSSPMGITPPDSMVQLQRKFGHHTDDLTRGSSRRTLNSSFEEVARTSSNEGSFDSAFPSVCNQLVSELSLPLHKSHPNAISFGSYVDLLRQQSGVSNHSIVCGKGQCNKAFHDLMGLIDKERPSTPPHSVSPSIQPGIDTQVMSPIIRLGEQSTWEMGEPPGEKTCPAPSRDFEPIGFSLGIEEDENSYEEGSQICPDAPATSCRMEEDINFGQNYSGVRGDTPIASGLVDEDVNFGMDGSGVRDDVGRSECVAADSHLLSSVPNMDEDDHLFVDAPPECDNLRGPAPAERNMDLKMGEDAIYVGRIFATKKDLHSTLCLYALKRLFNFRCNKSDKTRLIANCVDKKCSWRIYAVAHKGSENFEVRTMQLKHSCDVAARARYGQKATAKVLAGLMQHKFANGKKVPRACDLPDIVLAELKVNISYMKAWYTKEAAIATARGNDEESFNFLSTYLHLLRTTNPGTITEMVTTQDKNGNSQFKYLFVAFGASIAGFQFLRKVVVIDGTQMKGKYKGCLVAASGQDGNMQIFPLAFGVVDGENEASWVWFLKNMSKFIPDSNDLLIVSDRHTSIYAGIRAVYPLAHHGACTVHLCRNVRSRYKSEGLVAVVSKAARAYTVGDFRFWWAEIEKRSPACAQYLLDIGLPHWTLSHCPGMRYNIMSSNISESLNSALGKAVDYPISAMVEFLRMKLMRWFSTRRLMAKNSKFRCTPEIETLLIENLEEATSCAILSASEWIFQVNDAAGCMFTVDLEKKTCTCKAFDVLLVPCSHALAARGFNDLDLYTLVGDCYGSQTWYKLYECIVMPIPKVTDVDVPVSVTEVVVNPPSTRRGSGRPKKARIPSRGEGKYFKRKRVTKCGRCFGAGHNRTTCSAPI